MWGIGHDLVKPTVPAPVEVECSCGWHGKVSEFAEHVANVTRAARDRMTEFVDFMDEEIGQGDWGGIDKFAPDREFLTPARFVTTMYNLGFKKIR